MWFFYFKKLYFDLFLNLTPDQRIFKNNRRNELRFDSNFLVGVDLKRRLKHHLSIMVGPVCDVFNFDFNSVKLKADFTSPLKGRHPGYKDTGKFTTLKVIEEEKQVIRRCDKVNEATHTKIQSECAAAKLLNNPQHEAFKTLSSIEGLAILQGYGGSGKSYVLEALKKAYEAKRHYRKRVWLR